MKTKTLKLSGNMIAVPFTPPASPEGVACVPVIGPFGVPADFPVQPIGMYDAAIARCTCGQCGRSWDDGIPTSYTPAPSGRCPFEAFHQYEDDAPSPSVVPVEVPALFLCACMDGETVYSASIKESESDVKDFCQQVNDASGGNLHVATFSVPELLASHAANLAKIKALTEAITVAPTPPCDGDWESEGGRAAQDSWMAQYSLFLEFAQKALALPSAPPSLDS